jgi:hypothetical protein
MLYLHLLLNKIADAAAMFSVGPRHPESHFSSRPMLSIVR